MQESKSCKVYKVAWIYCLNWIRQDEMENISQQLRLYARAEVLIIDEFLLNPTTQEQQGDILELLELRNDSHTTIIASQFTPDGWFKNLVVNE